MNVKNLTGLLLLFFITVSTGCAAASQETKAPEKEMLPHPEVARISCEDLKQKIDNKEDVVIVDTRDALSYEDAHIPGAINVYYDPIADPTTRQMTLVALPMNREIVIYCP